MKFLIVFACVAFAAGDVSHLANLPSNEYLPPNQIGSSSVVSSIQAPVVSRLSLPDLSSHSHHHHLSSGSIPSSVVSSYSSPIASSYSAPISSSYLAPISTSYSSPILRTVSTPSVQYTSRTISAPSVSVVNSGYNSDLLSNGLLTGSRLVGSDLVTGGLSSAYDSGLIGNSLGLGDGVVSSQGLLGSPLRSDIISAPSVSLDQSIGTEYDSNGGYVYKKH